MKNPTGTHYKRLLLTLLAVCIIGTFTSCKKASEKASEELIEKSLGDDAKVDIDEGKVVIETDEGTFTTDTKTRSWPKEIGNAIPKFNYGSVSGVTTQKMKDADNWVIVFEEVPETAIKDYREVLKKNGFTISLITTADKGGHLAAEKDKVNVMVMSGNGQATVSVGIKN